MVKTRDWDIRDNVGAAGSSLHDGILEAPISSVTSLAPNSLEPSQVIQLPSERALLRIAKLTE